MACTLDGLTQFLTGTTRTSQDIGTFAGWFKPTFAPSASGAVRRFIWNDDDPGNIQPLYGLHKTTNANEMAIRCDGRTALFDVTGLWSAAAWVPFAFLYNKTGNIQRLFIAGAEVTAASASGTWGTELVGQTFNIGAGDGGGETFDGAVAEIAHWRVELGSAEIAALAKAVSPQRIRPASLNAYWRIIRPQTGLSSFAPRAGKTAGGVVPPALNPVDAPATSEHCRMVYPSQPKSHGVDTPVKMKLSVNGTDRSFAFARESLRITDAIEEEPNTCTLEVFGFTPVENQVIVVGRGSLVGTVREFRGSITDVDELRFKLTQGRVTYKVTAVDWTPLLGTRLITAKYSATSASTIAAAIVALAPTGFTGRNVVASLANVTIQFKMTPLDEALTQLARLIGGYWYVDADKDIHFYLTETSASPQAIVATPHEGAFVGPLQYTTNIDEIRNKVWVEGLGSAVGAEIAVGGTTIPVQDAEPFGSSGTNYAAVGNQVLTYTGKHAGGVGSTVQSAVGAPGSAPSVALGSGVGGVVGDVRYKTTFKNTRGETLPSAATGIVTGVAHAAPSIPSIAVVSSGGFNTPGWLIGALRYKVTHVTARGETTPSSDQNRTAVQNGPSNSPSLGGGSGLTVYSSLEVGSGTYNWKSSWVGPDGRESVLSSARLANGITASATAPSAPSVAAAAGGALDASVQYGWKVSFIDRYGHESALTGAVTLTTDSTNKAATLTLPTTAGGSAVNGNVVGRRIYRTLGGGSTYYLLKQIDDNVVTTYLDQAPDDVLAIVAPSAATMAGEHYVSIDVGPAGTSERRLYRTKSGGSVYYFVGALGHNNAGSVLDVVGDADLTQVAPSVSTVGEQHTITIATGATGTLARRIYRTVAGGTTYYLLTEVPDNSTTTYVDNIPDTGLASQGPPLTNTAGASQVSLTSIPTGGASITARRIYRTEAGGSIYYFVAEIPDNATTIYTDILTDAELGDTAPAVGTIGALAGDTTLQLVDRTNFIISGNAGWARVGEQFIRFADTNAANQVTGIPASGPGSLLTALSVGEPVLVAPQLTGIPASSTGSVLYAIDAGEEINTLVVREDATSQSTYGVREHYIQDRRLTIASAEARGDAELTLYKDPKKTGSFISEDVLMQSGKTLSIDMSSPGWTINGTFTILRGEVFMVKDRPLPQRRVSFSNQKNVRDLHAIIKELEGRQIA